MLLGVFHHALEDVALLEAKILFLYSLNLLYPLRIRTFDIIAFLLCQNCVSAEIYRSSLHIALTQERNQWSDKQMSL